MQHQFLDIRGGGRFWKYKEDTAGDIITFVIGISRPTVPAMPIPNSVTLVQDLTDSSSRLVT